MKRHASALLLVSVALGPLGCRELSSSTVKSRQVSARTPKGCQLPECPLPPEGMHYVPSSLDDKGCPVGCGRLVSDGEAAQELVALNKVTVSFARPCGEEESCQFVAQISADVRGGDDCHVYEATMKHGVLTVTGRPVETFVACPAVVKDYPVSLAIRGDIPASRQFILNNPLAFDGGSDGATCPLISCPELTPPAPDLKCTAIPAPVDANGCPTGCVTLECS